MSNINAPNPTSSIVARSFDEPESGSARSTNALVSKRVNDVLDKVEDAVEEVYQFANAKALYLAHTVGRHPDYYMGVILRRFAFLHPTPRHTSPYLSKRMKRCDVALEEPREKDVEAQRQFIREFQNLTGVDKEALLALLEVERYGNRRLMASRAEPSDCAQEVDDIFEFIKALFLYLKCRCGVDGFVCLVRSNVAYTLPPKWFFTSPQLNHHLSTTVDKWDASSIGRHLEGFSLSLHAPGGAVPFSSLDERVAT